LTRFSGGRWKSSNCIWGKIEKEGKCKENRKGKSKKIKAEMNVKRGVQKAKRGIRG
jgi:hypothetical protein